MKKKILTGINAMIAAMMGFLAVGCKEPVNMYGVPHADLNVSGTITDEENQPLKDIKVQVRLLGYTPGPKYSDENGKYLYHSQEGLEADSVDILVQDTTGVYAPDSARVAVDLVKYDKIQDWQVGEATAKKDFQLKKNN